MIKGLKVSIFLLSVTTIGFLVKYVLKSSNVAYFSYSIEENTGHDSKTTCTVAQDKVIETSSEQIHSTKRTLEDVLSHGDNIIFLETTDRMQLPSLVLCAIESAARAYPDRHVVFLMKGLTHANSEDDGKMALRHYPTISHFNNIHIYPLIMEQLFSDTPLLSWYMKVNTTQERFWTHVTADGCRLAAIWKYGGIYMDSDIISIRPIPDHNFLAAEGDQDSSNGVFGFFPKHNFTWTCMEDFVKKYKYSAWGNQGPILFSRILKTQCSLPNFKGVEDIICGNITFLHPNRFYPISYPAWRQYYVVWDKLPTFNDSHALHLWNYMNHDKIAMVPGSKTLVEHLYQKHCPSTYTAIQRNASTYI
ncbi:alpha-1,4-N-acetylglucosaminyltransferase-like [Hyperolius riggenbachi]|uniref:alpha-1,4-N-acetylglucosaminyltransferase-like n=1 Tax=Hyperolius riggenbachi TaxID=752182 RepID=UPI0035A315C6